MFLSFVPFAVTYQNKIENERVPTFMFTVLELAFGGTPACLLHISVYEEQIAWDFCYFSLLARAWEGLRDSLMEDLDKDED